MVLQRNHKTVRKTPGLLMAAAVAILLAACGGQSDTTEKKAAVTGEDVKRETKEGVETTQAYLIEQKEEYENQVRAKLDELDARMEELQAQAKATVAQTGADLKDALEDFRRKRDAAQKDLEKLEDAAVEGWELMKAGMDNALEEVEQAYEKAASHLTG